DLAHQAGQHLTVLGEHDGAVGHAQLQVLPGRTVTVPTLPLLTVSGSRMGTEMEVQQGVHTRVDDEHHIAAVAAVATVGTTERFELLAMHRGAAVPSVTRGEMNHHAIHEPGCHYVAFLRATGKTPVMTKRGTGPDVFRARPSFFG